MELKILATFKYIKYLICGLALFGTFPVLNDVVKHPDRTTIGNATIILAILYSICLSLMLVTRPGTYIKITEMDVFASEGFIKHKYSIENIKSILEFNNIYYGPVLGIDFIDQNGLLKRKKLLNLKAYSPEDIKKLMRLLHEKRPDLELPKNYL